jgi:hypothetical protein
MTGRVEVLLERLLATERSIAVVAFKDVSWGPEMYYYESIRHPKNRKSYLIKHGCHHS